jgi:hypothetical protein
MVVAGSGTLLMGTRIFTTISPGRQIFFGECERTSLRQIRENIGRSRNGKQLTAVLISVKRDISLV